MNWNYLIEDAPQTGSQLLVEVTSDVFQVVSFWDGGWRENTNGLQLKRPFKRWLEIEA